MLGVESLHRGTGVRFTILLCAAACLVATRSARADEPPPVRKEGETPRTAAQVLLFRTTIVGAPETGATGRSSRRETAMIALGQRLDVILNEAIQDFGLPLDLSEREAREDRELTDLELLALAAKGNRWVVYPALEGGPTDPVVRLSAVAPGSKVVLVRTEPVKANDLAVRAVVMLRDVITMHPTGTTPESGPRRPERAEAPSSFAVRARSQGRATLAFNAALFGGFVGYSVQRGSGSDDPRLLFPLMALGTGLGLGASAIVAEEWDVGLGDAWYLSAAAWWPALSGLFLARSREQSDPSTENSWAIIGALTGLGLATTSLAVGGGMSEGGALMTHSGGAFGTLLGGMSEFAVRGTTEGKAPYRGLGIGAAAGVVVAGTVAIWLDVEPSRVLAIDLGAGLGGLAGAAATSPFIFRERTAAGDRVFLITTMGSTLAGGVAAWFWTRRPSPPKARAWMTPYAGVIGESLSARGERSPALGVGLSGTFR